LPKVGKTGELVNLAKMQDCLIIDTEEGTKTYDTVAVNISNTQGVTNIIESITAEGMKRAAAGKKGMDIFPYKFLALDTLDKFEDFAEVSATENYRMSVLNKKGLGDFAQKYRTVLELPQGGGYYYLRNEVMDNIAALAKVCPYLILIVHVKEKMMLDKANQEVKVNDISLTGKLASMVCAEADAIGYMYRNPKGELRISFQTYDGAVMGARQRYLAGQDMPFAWETIYPDVFPAESSVNPNKD
jgi:hypothetical protein